MGLNMRAKEELIRVVEGRNKLRAEVGLPLVSIPKEVKKLEVAERQKDYDERYAKWYAQNATIISRITNEVLELERKKRGIPNWVPTLLNGGSEFTKRVKQRVQKEMRVKWME
jgi:hypothetical protein